MMRVAAAVIKRQGRLLIARRGPADRLAGRWELPGGKLEDGEDPAACLRRELREELGLDCEVGQQLAAHTHTLDGEPFELIALAVVSALGGPRPRVHDRLAWVRPGEAGRHDLLEADRPLIRALEQQWDGIDETGF